MKRAGIWALSLVLLVAGIAHLLVPEMYEKVMPPVLPFPYALVILSGIAEIVIGLALFNPRTRKLGAWAAIALFVAVFPANVYMLMVGAERFPNIPHWALVLRLPMQLLLIWWAYLYTASPGGSAWRSGSSRS